MHGNSARISLNTFIASIRQITSPFSTRAPSFTKGGAEGVEPRKKMPIFRLLQKTGGISEHDMFNTFNMGVGMSIVVAKDDVETALSILKDWGEDAYVIGEIEESQDKITICDE